MYKWIIVQNIKNKNFNVDSSKKEFNKEAVKMTKKVRSKSLANSLQSKQAGVRYFLACITTGLQLLDMISRAMFQTISPD